MRDGAICARDRVRLTTVSTMKDISLLQREMDTLWGMDAYGRREPAPCIAVAQASDGRAVRFSAAIPSAVRQRLDAVANTNNDSDSGSPPPEVILAQQLLGASAVTSGPSYVIENADWPAAPTIIASQQETSWALPPARPEQWWEPQEWADLLAGNLGPWAAAVDDAGEVLALCHTPRAHQRCAEAGVWTHPDHRGRGYAQAVTMAWAVVARPHYDLLFYSTSEHNRASQGVARVLGLRPIGRIWQIRQ
jgi:RimJ/RimL family protein N-acetyltransferase